MNETFGCHFRDRVRLKSCNEKWWATLASEMRMRKESEYWKNTRLNYTEKKVAKSSSDELGQMA